MKTVVNDRAGNPSKVSEARISKQFIPKVRFDDLRLWIDFVSDALEQVTCRQDATIGTNKKMRRSSHWPF